MASRKEIEDQIAELQRQAEEMGDDDNDFEVEIWDADGNGARVPYHKGKSWLQKFGIDVPPPDESGSGDDKNGKGGERNRGGNSGGGTGGTGNPPGSEVGRTSQRYFGKRPAAGK